MMTDGDADDSESTTARHPVITGTLEGLLNHDPKMTVADRDAMLTGLRNLQDMFDEFGSQLDTTGPHRDAYLAELARLGTQAVSFANRAYPADVPLPPLKPSAIALLDQAKAAESGNTAWRRTGLEDIERYVNGGE